MGKAFALAAHTQSLPFQGRWLGEAETERLLQICDDLSVSLRLTAPLQGEPWMVHIPQAPFTQGSLWVVVGQGWENDCCFLGRDAA